MLHTFHAITTKLAATTDSIPQINTSPLPNATADSTTLSTIMTIVFEIVGAMTLLMVVVGGLRYIIASGDPAKMAQAKKTIIYALVGLVVTMSAYAIVRFVVKGIS